MNFEFNLDIPDDVLYMAELFRNEWCNGGFSQLFANWEPSDAKLIPDGLRQIGASAVADIVALAIAEMGPSEQWQEKGHYALFHTREPLFMRLSDLDDQLAKHSEQLDALIDQFDLKLNGDGSNDLEKAS